MFHKSHVFLRIFIAIFRCNIAKQSIEFFALAPLRKMTRFFKPIKTLFRFDGVEIFFYKRRRHMAVMPPFHKHHRRAEVRERFEICFHQFLPQKFYRLKTSLLPTHQIAKRITSRKQKRSYQIVIIRFSVKRAFVFYNQLGNANTKAKAIPLFRREWIQIALCRLIRFLFGR